MRRGNSLLFRTSCNQYLLHSHLRSVEAPLMTRSKKPWSICSVVKLSYFDIWFTLLQLKFLPPLSCFDFYCGSYIASLPKLNFFIISKSFVTSTPMLCEGCRNCLIKKVDEARCLWFYCHWLSCKRRHQGKGGLIKTPNEILQHQRAGRTHKFGHFLALFLPRIRFGSLQPPDWPSARAWYNLYGGLS